MTIHGVVCNASEHIKLRASVMNLGMNIISVNNQLVVIHGYWFEV